LRGLEIGVKGKRRRSVKKRVFWAIALMEGVVNKGVE
jgi:hypothetical protein